MVFRYPALLGKTEEDIDRYFKSLTKQRMSNQQAFDILFELPQLVSFDLEAKLEEFFFLFDLYTGMQRQDVMKIVSAFPYVLTVQPLKIQQFCGLFKKHKLTHKQILNYTINSGGLLGSTNTNFKGVFDTLRQYGVTAKEAVGIFDMLPQFTIQNRSGALLKKIRLIQSESGRDDYYMKQLIKRHPDIIMKSVASLEAKINYIQRELNRPLKQEQAFPLILIYNYNEVMRPRCDILKEKLGGKNFKLGVALAHSDEKFCAYYNVDLEELRQMKRLRQRKDNSELDKMWVYHK
uniref:Uncharacterized protein n=1 Tax=Strombidium rassoulzadegani TaxID=1082188 RepID=A0A7S3CN79_9SPIT|mmetsp:Transcript_17588/g.29690  ORF Transcript_17588/g.29690 Transcript_17588/m.29690 type:complete len:292 (+) Transcript_17588:633-1508(+)